MDEHVGDDAGTAENLQAGWQLRALTVLQEILNDTEVLLGISALGLSLVYILPKPGAVCRDCV